MTTLWNIGPLEISIFHVALVFLVIAVYLLLLFFTKCVSLSLFHQNQPPIFRQFQQIAHLQAIRSPNFSLFYGSETHSTCPSSAYEIDRLSIEKLLRNLFDQSIIVPDTCVAVQIPTIFSTCGPQFHQFQCKPPVPEWTAQSIICENQYSYKMWAGGQIQAVYHIDRRSYFLAGLLIYLRIPAAPWFFRGISEPFVMEMLRGNVRKCSTMGLATIRILRPIEPLDEEDSGDEEVLGIREPSPPPYATIVENDLPPDYFSLFSRIL